MEKLLLLHGAIGSKTQFDTLLPHLEGQFEIFTLNFSGHGGVDFSPNGLNFNTFTEDIHNLLLKNSIPEANIFGYSMGGYAALAFALKHPSMVKKVFTLGTKFFWDKDNVKEEMKMLNPEKILEKVPAFSHILEKRHFPTDWKSLMIQTTSLMMELAEKPALDESSIKSLQMPVLVASGDRDHTAGIEDTVRAFRLLKNGRLWIAPGTQHPLEKVSPERLAVEIKDFFGTAPPAN